MKTALKVLFSAVFVFMTYSVVTTSIKSNLFKEWDYLAGIPWMKATIQDFYANALVIMLWVAYKETNWFSKVIWIILLAALGSIATAGYLVLQLFKLKNGEGIKELLVNQN